MSPVYDFDLICIGSGPAGQRAAVQASKLGRRAAVVEKRRCVGGACIDTGTIPSKTLREAVVTFSGLAGKGDRLPWARVESRPTCQQLFAGVDSVIAREVEVIESQLRRKGRRIRIAVSLEMRSSARLLVNRSRPGIDDQALARVFIRDRGVTPRVIRIVSMLALKLKKVVPG